MIKIYFTFFLILSFITSNAQNAFMKDSTYRNGDIIFIKHKKANETNLLPIGKTSYTYVGVIFIENDMPYVYHAYEPVSKSPLGEFLGFSEGKDYVIKRLIDQSVLTTEAINTMRLFANANLGQHYDNQLKLGNDTYYNSEFVWKIYTSALGFPLAAPKEVKDYKLEDALRTEFLTEAYGESILKEKMIAVGDIYRSEFLEQ
jgi:hypothetical protein